MFIVAVSWVRKLVSVCNGHLCKGNGFLQLQRLIYLHLIPLTWNSGFETRHFTATPPPRGICSITAHLSTFTSLHQPHTSHEKQTFWHKWHAWVSRWLTQACHWLTLAGCGLSDLVLFVTLVLKLTPSALYVSSNYLRVEATLYSDFSPLILVNAGSLYTSLSLQIHIFSQH